MISQIVVLFNFSSQIIGLIWWTSLAGIMGFALHFTGSQTNMRTVARITEQIKRLFD
jgi:hypothetical protein